MFYNLLLHLYALISFPKWRKKRLGFGFPKVEGPVIWVHAVSMGEVKAVTPLVKELRKKHRVLISTVTDTGFASLPDADYKVYLPFDLPYIIKPIVRRVAPTMIIICETDLWYNFLSATEAPVVLVNGKISKRSMRRHLRFPRFCRKLLGQVDLFCVQDETYRERFARLGVKNLHVTGNLKFDALVRGDEEQLNRGEGPLVVIGSTHDPEEEQILQALEPVWKQYPTMHVWLVPRHPQRFERVRRLLEVLRISTDRVTLLGRVGVLRSAYAQADVAIVAGSFTSRVGGHNILEPLFYGVPLLFGPHMENQPELEKCVLEAGAGRQVELGELAAEVSALLCDPQENVAGRELVASLCGATERTLKCLREKGLLS